MNKKHIIMEASTVMDLSVEFVFHVKPPWKIEQHEDTDTGGDHNP